MNSMIEKLSKDLTELKQQRDQISANLSAVSGAIQYAESLLTDLKTESAGADEQPEETGETAENEVSAQ